MSLEVNFTKLTANKTASPLMSKLHKFDDELSPCDFALGGALPLRKQVAALVTRDFVASVVERLTDLRHVQHSAAIP